MALKDDLEDAVTTTLRDTWEERDGRGVPDVEDLGLGNVGVKLDATVLYADMSGSTALVDSFRGVPRFPAEIYKCYLTCAAKIIKAEGGVIRAYDGDRIMAVFIGTSKNTSAARAGLKINHAVVNIVNPRIERYYPKVTYRLAHVVGIDTSPIFAARIGVRLNNDLVWVGRAANYAAKLTELGEPNTVFVTNDVFNLLHDEAKFSPKDKTLIWRPRTWTNMGNMAIHSSTWWWEI
jgi:class 3 adenylate cyclase